MKQIWIQKKNSNHENDLEKINLRQKKQLALKFIDLR